MVQGIRSDWEPIATGTSGKAGLHTCFGMLGALVWWWYWCVCMYVIVCKCTSVCVCVYVNGCLCVCFECISVCDSVSAAVGRAAPLAVHWGTTYPLGLASLPGASGCPPVSPEGPSNSLQWGPLSP